MLRPLSLLPALAVSAAAAWAALSGSAAAAAPAAEDGAPLEISIDGLAPATIPERGRITVSGSVTNVSGETWTDISLYPFVSTTPLTTRAELAEAVVSDPAVPVGDRVVAGGAYRTIDELAPGQTLSYTVRVRSSELRAHVAERGGDLDSVPGVYWFGIHALGSSPTFAADLTSDGRARTFLPRLGGSGRQVKTALVVPLREGLEYDADGALTDPAGWAESLAPDGELGSLLRLGQAAGSRPLTWLVDPALTGAAERLAAGNPGRQLGPTVDPEATEDPDLPDAEATGSSAPTPSQTPGSAPPTTVETTAPADGDGEQDGEQGDGQDGGQEEEPSAAEAAAAQAASGWLEDLQEVLASQQVLALPYGDLDVSAAAEQDAAAYPRARQRSGTALPAGVQSSPGLTGPRGYLSPRALQLADEDETVIGSDLMVPTLGTSAPTVATVDGRRLVLASSGAATGGPGPDDRLGDVALRQRILAEAAVRRLERPHEPLVVVLPTGWSPKDVAGFFTGLDQDWLDLTTVGDVLGEPATPVDAAELDYPRAQVRHQLDERSFDAAAELTRAGTTLQYLLTRNDTVAGEVADQAMSSLSSTHRADAASTRLATDRSSATIESLLRGVRIEGPPKVTLSSASGRFSATLENTLDEPVTVRVRAIAEEPITISMAEEDVRLPPHSRRSVLLTAATEQQGVHRITLQVTDIAGTALGDSYGVPIRAAQVSDVIWLIIGTGAALLFAAIGLRLTRRLRRARRTPADAQRTEQMPTPV